MNHLSPLHLALRSRAEQARSGPPAGALPTPQPDMFVRLYYAIEALRTEDGPGIVVQFIAPDAGAGVSTVASGYARVAASERQQSVLYLDCGAAPAEAKRPGSDEPFIADHRAWPCLMANGAPPRAGGWQVMPLDRRANLMAARLSDAAQPLLAIGGTRLAPILAALRRDFGVVILDCPAATQPEAAALGRHADGTVLVAAAGQTKARQLAAVRADIEQLGGQIVGVVFNRTRPVLPRWLDWLP